MSRIKKILRLANKIPNQILMEGGVILIKANKIDVKTMTGEGGNKMTIDVDVYLEKVKKIEL
jgi:hypothetical protein